MKTAARVLKVYVGGTAYIYRFLTFQDEETQSPALMKSIIWSRASTEKMHLYIMACNEWRTRRGDRFREIHYKYII